MFTNDALNIKQVKCKSLLIKSRLPGLDYTINPIVGCQHACQYCYARYLTRKNEVRENWGTYLELKTNALDVLRKDAKIKKQGTVSLSTFTDPYQKSEADYKLTREILKILKQYNFNVSILTKSPLVLRDTDILKQFDRNSLEVGFSINTMNESVREIFEPKAPAINERIEALKSLHASGIRTWVFVAPVLPYISKYTIKELLLNISGHVDYIMVDKLNIKPGAWESICSCLDKIDKGLINRYEKLFQTSNSLKYSYHRSSELIRYCAELNIKCHLC